MGTEEWHSDILVTEELVADCLQEQFSALNPLSAVKYIDEGWDNKVFLVNKNIIFRFPHRKAATTLIARENTLLSNLPHFSGIGVPKLKYIGHPSPRYPYPFHGYEMIKGVSGYQANLSEKARTNSVATIALFLKQLHQIDESQAIAMGATPQAWGSRSNLEHVVTILNERVNKINIRGTYCINKDILTNEIAVAEKLILPAERCLIHGDLDCRHLIFNQMQLTGVIDWGDTDIASKAIDLSIIWDFYPADCHAKFFEIYGRVDQDTWQYARFIGLYSAISLLLYGEDLNNIFFVREAINSLRRMNADLLIG